MVSCTGDMVDTFGAGAAAGHNGGLGADVVGLGADLVKCVLHLGRQQVGRAH